MKIKSMSIDEHWIGKSLQPVEIYKGCIVLAVCGSAKKLTDEKGNEYVSIDALTGDDFIDGLLLESSGNADKFCNRVNNIKESCKA